MQYRQACESEGSISILDFLCKEKYTARYVWLDPHYQVAEVKNGQNQEIDKNQDQYLPVDRQALVRPQKSPLM